MSKETPVDDPRQRTNQGGHSQTDKPWKGNPEKEQKPGTKKVRSGPMAGNKYSLGEKLMGLASYEIVGDAGEWHVSHDGRKAFSLGLM